MGLRNALKRGMDFVFGLTEHEAIIINGPAEGAMVYDVETNSVNLAKVETDNSSGAYPFRMQYNDNFGLLNLRDDSDTTLYQFDFTSGDMKATTPGQGVILTSPDGTEHRVVVANDGTLSTETV